VAAHFAAHRGDLSEDSQRRLDANPLRILDSKDARDQSLVAGAPQIDNYFTTEAGAFFEQLQKGLQASGIAWQRNARLVRGLDYYRHSVFEFVTESLGAQGTVLGGGRYDGLIGHMGGPDTPAVGWAAGIERLAMLCGEMPPERPFVAVITEDGTDPLVATTIVQQLRAAGIVAEQPFRGNAKRQIEIARKRGAMCRLVLIDNTNSSGLPERSGLIVRINQLTDTSRAHSEYRDTILKILENSYKVIRFEPTGGGFDPDAVLQELA
jgi:histidyl-tRNA synthetase